MVFKQNTALRATGLLCPYRAKKANRDFFPKNTPGSPVMQKVQRGLTVVNMQLQPRMILGGWSPSTPASIKVGEAWHTSSTGLEGPRYPEPNEVVGTVHRRAIQNWGWKDIQCGYAGQSRIMGNLLLRTVSRLKFLNCLFLELSI